MLSETRATRPHNGYHGIETVIGYVETTEPKTHKISYETASAYTLVEVPAGRYEIVLSASSPGIRWVLVRYCGIVTDDHYENRLFGASSIAPKRGIGEERTCSDQLYPYIAAAAFATDPRWALAEDWTIESEECTRAHDGSTYTAYSLHDPNGARVF